MTATLLALSLLLGSADDLNWKSFELVRMRIPTSWYHQRKTFFSGRLVSKSSDVYTSPSGDAFVIVDVDAVKAEGMSGDECRKEVLLRLQPDGVELYKIDKRPAARWETGDFIFNQGIFAIQTFVGCDGQTVWALNFHFMEGSRQRYESMGYQMAGSVHYMGTPNEIQDIRDMEIRLQRSTRGNAKGG